ncbi:MAG: DsbE family thiol:disulfide interchange protein [Gammaproteobacteria bacterium]|nr:DsbE family thiol:disulfide interchange protein [Gammaproteobacteria bacterium]MDP7093063.1 DsbE family thiol:disulfide interchange protein [Gammaproteobacteria bacterium]MDP7271707.1 DsbE family thiol:disulfide interchange protein [Gammaproteobacteria bacterium]HJP03826.1 DsbE family thiol:disulfide interchange protein [Gammaproteobacteria bacterium]
MAGKLKFLIPIAVFAGMVAIFYKGLYSDPTLVSSPFIDKAAPVFNLPTLYDDQKHITEAEFKGRISLFNVWASWCPGCAREHEMLLMIARDTDIPIYGLNWKDERQAAQKWLRERGNPYTVNAVDRDNVTGIDWGVYGAPETFLIDGEGIIRYKHIGPLTPEIWAAEFLPRIETARATLAGADS